MQELTQTSSQKQVQKMIPKLKESPDDLSNPYGDIRPAENLKEDIDDEDLSVTEQKKIEEYENQYINPEVGFIYTKKPSFAVLKTSNGHVIISLRKRTIPKGLKNIFLAFPKFENITVEKIAELATDDRTSNSHFAFPRQFSFDYLLLLPNGEIINLGVLKRSKGKSGKSDIDEKEAYRSFREIVFEKADEMNSLTKESFSEKDVENFESFLNSLCEKIDLKGIKKDDFKKAVNKSKMSRKVIEEYLNYFKGGL